MNNFDVLLQTSYSQEMTIIEHVADTLGCDTLDNKVYEDINNKSLYELVDAYLEEEGIIGYTWRILDLVQTLMKGGME